MKTISLSILVLFVTSLSGVSQTVSQIIQQKIEAGVESKKVTVDGVALYSQKVLPAFYTDNAFKPAWNNKDIKALIKILESSYYEGLTPDDYHLQRIYNLVALNSSATNAQLADLDLLLTDGILRYSSHLIKGKVDQSKIRKGWNIPGNELPENSLVMLENALNADDINKKIESFKPTNFMYNQLKLGLAVYRKIADEGGFPNVEVDKVLKPGMKDKTVLSLRNYLQITGDYPLNLISDNDSIYDEFVENAVKHFQFRHNLIQDGVLGKGTLAAMNVPVEKRIDEIRINLERARWVMHDLESDFLVANIAGYNLRRVTADSVMFYSKIIVGKHYHESPIFKSQMKYIVINPTWTLTHSIAVKETLPKLKKDPEYLAKHNMIIMDHSGKVIDPSTLDFKKMSAKDFHYIVRQNAGPNNSLGQVKFIFPNSYSIYIHDTPVRSLFEREKRAFSHGCLRLDKKWELFLSLVGNQGWDMERINKVLESGETTRVNLETPIDVLVLYWTAGADKLGNLFFNEDIYDRDPAVLGELNRPLD